MVRVAIPVRSGKRLWDPGRSRKEPKPHFPEMTSDGRITYLIGAKQRILSAKQGLVKRIDELTQSLQIRKDRIDKMLSSPHEKKEVDAAIRSHKKFLRKVREETSALESALLLCETSIMTYDKEMGRIWFSEGLQAIHS